MKPHLCKAGVQLRNQIDDCYGERDRRSDGWIGDAKHTSTKSDHNPALPDLVVRALDVDSDLSSHKSESVYLANHISFTPKGDNDGSFFEIPLLGGKQ